LGLEAIGRNTQGLEEFRNLKDGAVMVRVPGGAFTMGCDTGLDSEKPARTVQIDAFLMDKTEVTVGRYRRFVEEAKYLTEVERRGYGLILKKNFWYKVPGTSWRVPGYPSTEEHPVTCVTWADAAAYARWAGNELPTEAQWERAARGSDGRSHPWGEGKAAERACFGAALPTPAGSFPGGASPWGILDLAGNVSELCSDWWDPRAYDAPERRNPKGPDRGDTHVLRGGSWTDPSDKELRSSRRWRVAIDGNNADGFRTVRRIP